MSLQLNPQQEAAVRDGIDWWKHGRFKQDKPQFHVTGVAGAGKSTMVDALLDRLDIRDSVKLVAPTWKAARVLAAKTKMVTSSVHALIYVPKADALQQLRLALTEEMARKEPCEEAIEAITSEMKELQSEAKDVEFVLNPLANKNLVGVSAILIDEASMSGEDMTNDLLELGIPLIPIYDPFQLPPVKAKFGWEGYQPEVFLTQIMRTGEGSGVALAAGDIRSGRELQSYGEDFKIYPKGRLNFRDYAEEFDMIIVGTNRLRRQINNGIRVYRQLPKYPVEGDKVISLNNQDNGISNGEVFTIEEVIGVTPRVITFNLIDQWGNRFKKIKAWREVFEDDEKAYLAPYGFGQFTYGYALTAHKSQGSEAPRVCVLDSWKGADYQRWLYTAVTRASQSAILVR